ncbi:MAG TPA: hypothetical protein VHA52_13620, partial [Candidatus Babeliaceae bacterium]|nr:hypothetical protein [Candidatus Babeliaceae bacterium]
MHRAIMSAFFRVFVTFLTFFVCSCGGKSSSFDYTIALDPSWYTLELPSREFNVTAFTLELIEAIGKEERVSIAVYQRSWD